MKSINNLSYPFDASFILKHKKSLKKSLLENQKEFMKVKIALLSGSTIGYIKDILELFLLKNNIQPEFFEGNYNRFFEDVMFDNQALIDFKPDLVFIHTSNKNIEQYNDLENEYSRFYSVWQKLNELFNCKIIQNNFDMPDYRILGNRDIYDKNGQMYFLHSLNDKFYKYAQTNPNFYINDLNYLSSKAGLDNWHNPIHWHMYKYVMDISCIPDFAFNLSNIIKSIYGKNKKTLLLDLDNTLWGGIIGDIGEDNIEIGMETPSGEAYLEFHKYLKKLSQNGIILNIVSKNEEKSALKGFLNDKSFLKIEDFVNYKINWAPKSENIKQILKEINLLPESAVFVDDNPVERDEVTLNMPEVEVINSSDILDFIKYIDRNGYFEVTTISEDDKKRLEYYKMNLERTKVLSSFKNYNDYLKSLKMVSNISFVKNETLERAVQLLNKTNQFNLTQKKYTYEDIQIMQNNQNAMCITADLEDKFGKNGIVSVLVGKIECETFEIENWVMSCRVFKRALENAFFDYLVEFCKLKGIQKIVAQYTETSKNGYVKNLYTELGFKIIVQQDTMVKYEFEISGYKGLENEIIDTRKEIYGHI